MRKKKKKQKKEKDNFKIERERKREKIQSLNYYDRRGVTTLSCHYYKSMIKSSMVGDWSRKKG